MSQTASHVEPHTFVKSIHGTRYQVKDVARSVAFYTQQLGLKLEHQQLPAFATVSLGDTKVLLSGPGASGSRPLPNGEYPVLLFDARDNALDQQFYDDFGQMLEEVMGFVADSLDQPLD